MRKPIIAGNWKMNNKLEDTIKFFEDLKSMDLNDEVEVLVCPSFLSLEKSIELTKASNIKIGAQNCHWEESGAYTGEVSLEMLKEIGVSYVIIGHSERRQYFNETDESVNKKILKALDLDINPILCVGESLEEKEAGKEKDVVKSQVVKALAGVKKDDIKKLVIAYEPIWAIGTGKTASSEDASEMLIYIRSVIKDLYKGEEELVRLQYGGSVKPSNIKELMSKESVDGALVGGASLNPEDFSQLVNF